jgi:hypothetical protein
MDAPVLFLSGMAGTSPAMTGVPQGIAGDEGENEADRKIILDSETLLR